MFLLAGLAEGIMDWLQFKLPLQIKHKWVYHKFWDPRISWKNKWSYSTVTLDRYEKFFLSTTVLVFLTDGWNLMKWFRNRFIDIAFICFINFFEIPFLTAFLFVIILRLFYGLGFYLIFKKLL
jgi:hypothetical protein